MVVVAFIGLLVATWWMFKVTPTGFVPEEDKGAFMIMFNLKPGTALSKTSAESNKIMARSAVVDNKDMKEPCDLLFNEPQYTKIK